MAENTVDPKTIIGIYKQAVKNLPLLRYSWVLIATICILALAAYFKLQNFDVFFYAVGVMIISFLGFVFSYLQKTRNRFIRFLLYVLNTSVVITIVTATLSLASYIIWQKPRFYNQWFPNQSGETRKIQVDNTNSNFNNKHTDSESMQLTVYVYEGKDSMNIVNQLEGKGRLIVDFDNDRRNPLIGENGRTNMGEIPLKFGGVSVPIGIQSEDYEAAEVNKKYLMNGKPVYFQVKPKADLRTIEGSVRDINSMEFLDSVTIVCNGESTMSNKLGFFNLIMPVEKQQKRYELTIHRRGYITQTEYYVPRSTKADIRLRRKG